jgi:hypothetical protein
MVLSFLSGLIGPLIDIEDVAYGQATTTRFQAVLDILD